MKIYNKETISTNVSSNSSVASQSASTVKKISDIQADNTNTLQNGSKEWSQASTKTISQLSEYDKGNMPVSEKVVIEAIQKANKALVGGNRRFEFSIHEKTNEIMVKVYNSETDELIKEIPNEKILDMVASMCEMAGILVDERR